MKNLYQISSGLNQSNFKQNSVMIMHHFSDFRARKNTRKNMVFHSRNFPLLYVTVEEYLIISITFTFNFYFLSFEVDELHAVINIFYNYIF